MDYLDLLGQSPQAPPKPPLIVDIETVGTPFDGRVLTVGWKELGEDHAHVTAPGDVPDEVWAMMVDPLRPFVSFMRYDARFLRLIGRPVVGPHHDIQVMCWVDDENQKLSLEATVLRYLGKKMDKRLKRSGGNVWFTRDDGIMVPIEEAPWDQLCAYCGRDVDDEADLYAFLWNHMEDEGWLDYWLAEEVPFTETLLDMECRGLCIDLDRTEKLRDELEPEHAAMEAALRESGDLPPIFNLNAPKQLGRYLFTTASQITGSIPCMPGEYNGMEKPEKRETAQLVLDEIGVKFKVLDVGRCYIHGEWYFHGRGLPPGALTERSGEAATSKAALKTNVATASDPWVQDFLEYRQVDKLLSTYLRKFPEIAVEADVPGTSVAPEDTQSDVRRSASTRIFGRFNQTGTKTGRLSSSEPNLQNIPQRGKYGPRVRDLFRP